MALGALERSPRLAMRRGLWGPKEPGAACGRWMGEDDPGDLLSPSEGLAEGGKPLSPLQCRPRHEEVVADEVSPALRTREAAALAAWKPEEKGSPLLPRTRPSILQRRERNKDLGPTTSAALWQGSLSLCVWWLQRRAGWILGERYFREFWSVRGSSRREAMST